MSTPMSTPVSTPRARGAWALGRARGPEGGGEGDMRDDGGAAMTARNDASASASASASFPSTGGTTRTKATDAGSGRDNRAAVRRYRERKRMEERVRRAECERLQKENETLRGKLRMTEAELTHTKWLLTVVAWKYDVNLMDIPAHEPSTAMVPMEHLRGDDEDLLRVADEVSEKSARITETERPRAPNEISEKSARITETERPRAPNSKPPISPDELELKDFLEEYFTHGDACPCFDGMDTRELAVNSAMCLPAAHPGARRHRGA